MRDDHNDRTVVQRTDPLLGGVVANRFRIKEKIAAGGFGAIYRAQHLASGHEVAIKVLHPQLAADRNVIERFRREGSTLAKLRAPHTVNTYEFGETTDGMLYIVMELLRGVSLHERLRERGPMPWREALQIARAICISLAEAHALGIVHRDLKPANIHLETRGDRDYVKVLDFGIAKIKRGTSTDEQPELTNAGQMIGTIDYMAPEQILGAQADGRTDLFTLGILLFEMITGRRPFGESATPTSMLASLLTQTAPRLAQYAPVPLALDELVARCLQREAHDRFANVDELAAEMDRILTTSSDDGQTRTIAIGLHTQKWEDEEATVMADAEYRAAQRASRPVNTLESPAPPAPRQTPAPQLHGTPAPQRMRPATTPPPAHQRQHPPTPSPMSPAHQGQHPSSSMSPHQGQHPSSPMSPPHQGQHPSSPMSPAHQGQRPSSPMTPARQGAFPPTPSPGYPRQHPPTPSQMPSAHQGAFPPTPSPAHQRQHPHTPSPTPPPQRQHPPTPSPTPPPQRQHPPTPFPPYPYVQQPHPQWQTPLPPQAQVINPSANVPVDNSGWQVPRAGRASQPDPSAWQAYAGNASYSPPNAPAFAPPERRSEPPTPGPRKAYDPNRDEAVGRILWIVAIVLVIAIGFAVYKMVT